MEPKYEPGGTLSWNCSRGHANRSRITEREQEGEVVTLSCTTPGCDATEELQGKAHPARRPPKR
jgi:hypothetical protein